MPQVLRSIEMQAPPSVVWRWMATQKALRMWFSPRLEMDLQVGGAYRFFGPDNKTWVSGKVLELKPEESLILSWMEEGGDWGTPKATGHHARANPRRNAGHSHSRWFRRHRHAGLESYRGGLPARRRSAQGPG
jgi:uncharacterized protein YndB with AHSA1/START domain